MSDPPSPDQAHVTGRHRAAWRDLEPLTPTIERPTIVSSSRPATAAIDPTHRFLRPFQPRARANGAPRGLIVHSGPTLSLIPDEQPDADLSAAPIADISISRRASAIDRRDVQRPIEHGAEPVALDRISRPDSAAPRTLADAHTPAGADHRVDPAARPVSRLSHSRRLGLGRPTSPDDAEYTAAPVPADLAAAVSEGLGVSVDDVVIERGPRAAAAADEHGAAAFAEGGQRIVLPDALGGLDQPDVRGVIAHELTHIAQQRRLGAQQPDEIGPDGRRLEAEARAAEQSARGDLGAPDLAVVLRRQADAGATAGSTAGADDTLTDAPSSGVRGVQRLPAGTRTPNYDWQRQFVLEHGGDGWGELTDMFHLREHDNSADLEQRHLGALVRHRVERRADYVHNEAQRTARAAFRSLPPRPSTETATDPALPDAARAAQARIDEVEQLISADAARVTTHNEAVDQIDQYFPLRDFAADDGARYTAPSDRVEVWRNEAQTLRTEHPELLHRRPVAPAASAASVTTTVSLATPPAPAAAAPAAAPAAPVATPTPAAAPPAAAPSSPPTGAPAGGGMPNISWQAGVFSPGASDMSWDRLGDMFRMSDPTPQEREAEQRAEEQAHLPELKQARNQLLEQKVDQQITALRRDRFRQVPAHGTQGAATAEPDDATLLTQITRSEWQAIIDAVETERPLVYALDAANALLANASSAIVAAVTASPDSRPGSEAAAAAPVAAPTAAPVAAPATAPAATPAATLTATPAAPVPEPAPQSPEPTAQHTLPGSGPIGQAAGATATAALVGAVSNTMQPDAQSGGTRGEVDAEALEFSAQVINRLVAELYPKLRSRLRTELLVDRERAGVLADAR
jgi:hypothetical protein